MRTTLLGLMTVLASLGAAWLLGPWVLSGEGDMPDPRSEIHAAELDGTLYVAGGIGFFRTLGSCGAFDTGAKAFMPCPDLPRSLHHVAMAAGAGGAAGVGRVFASGGYVSLPFNQDQDGALFALDPSTDAGWTEISRLPRPLGQHAMVYYEGALWLIGGESGGETVATLRRYDLASGKWEERAPMQTARHSHAIAQGEDRLFVTGGRSQKLGAHSRGVEVYDFAADRWSQLPDAPFPLAGHGAAVFEGRLHVFGGENLDTAEVFDRHVSLDVASPEAGWREEEPMNLARHGFATHRVGDTAWIIGGGKRAGMRTPWSVTGTAQALNLGSGP